MASMSSGSAAASAATLGYLANRSSTTIFTRASVHCAASRTLTSQARRCETCGSTYSEIAKTGHVGCADCYDVFGDELFPLIRRIHGNTTHCGKNSDRTVQKAEKHEPTKEEKIAQLKNELDAAVKEQNFERAAELRDTIKGMEA